MHVNNFALVLCGQQGEGSCKGWGKRELVHPSGICNCNNGGESGRMPRQYKLQICVCRGEMNCNILWESRGEPLPAFMAKYLRLPSEAKGSHKMCANFSSLKNTYQVNYQNFYSCNCTPQKIGLPLAVKAASVIRVKARQQN